MKHELKVGTLLLVQHVKYRRDNGEKAYHACLVRVTKIDRYNAEYEAVANVYQENTVTPLEPAGGGFALAYFYDGLMDGSFTVIASPVNPEG